MKFLFSKFKEPIFLSDGLYKGKWTGSTVHIKSPAGAVIATAETELHSSHDNVECDIDIKQGTGTVTFKPKIDNDGASDNRV